MKYLLNEYLPFLDDICTRVVAYPENQIGARIVAEYKSRGINVFPVFSLLDCSRGWVPRPSEAIDCMRSFVEENKRPILFVGVDSYLEFLSIPERRDFFAGIYQLLELQKFCMHILVSLRIFRPYKSVNPKYEDSLQVIVFSGDQL